MQLVAALKLSDAGEKSVSTGNELLADIQHVFAAKRIKNQNFDKISSVDLIAALVAIDDGAWATYNRGKPLSPRQLARQLAGYGIKSKTVRLGHKNTPKGYEVSEFKDVFARYLAPPVDLPPRGNDSPESYNDEGFEVADANDTKVY